MFNNAGNLSLEMIGPSTMLIQIDLFKSDTENTVIVNFMDFKWPGAHSDTRQTRLDAVRLTEGMSAKGLLSSPQVSMKHVQ